MPFDAGAIIARLELNTKQWEQTIARVKGDQASLAGYVLRNEQAFQGMGRAMAIAGGAVVASFGALVKKTADYGDELNDLSKRTGVSTETLSGLKLAADKSGSSLEGLATGFRGLANAMQGAASGNKDMAARFAALGVSVTHSGGSLRDMKDVMFDVADRFAAMKDGAEKTALAQDLFGKSGMALIPMLNLGSAGLKAEWEQAEKLGLVMSGDAAAACDQFNDSVTDLKGGLQGLVIQLGTALMPVIKGAVAGLQGFIGMVKDAAAAHPALITAVGALAGGFGGMALVMGPLLMALPKLVTGFQLLKVMLGTTALGVTALTAIFTASLGVVILYISKLWELGAAEDRLQASTKTLWETENNLVDKLSAAASAADWQYGRMSELIKAYDFNYIALIKAIQAGKEGVDIQKALADVCDKHREAIDKQRAATAALNPLLEGTGRIITDVLVPALDKTKTSLVEVAQTIAIDVMPKIQGLTGIMDQIPGIIGGVDWNPLADGAKTATDTTKSYFDGLFNDIATGFGNTIQSWLSGATTFKDFMSGLWGNIKDSFFRMVGEMIAKWVVGFIGNLVSSAVTGAASMAASMGAAVTSIGAAAAGLAAGIATVIVTLATAIASAATIIAAAAPAIIVTSLLAMGIMAGLNLLKRLFAQGGAGAGDGMGRVVERQDIQISLLTQLKDLTLDNRGNLDVIKGMSWAINSTLKTATGYLKTIANTIQNLPTAASGAVSTQTQLMVVHGTRSDPEYILRASQLNSGVMPRATGGGGQARAGAANITFNIQALDGSDVVSATRRIIIPELQRFYRHGGQIPSSAVGGA